MNIYTDFSQLIGHTPLYEPKRFSEKHALSARLLLKLECFNPAGSAKDRVGLEMINDAERRGVLKNGGVIIEPTSGNTGIGIAAVAASRGYRVIIAMPETMSAERRALMRAYGAELVLTDGEKGMSGAIEEAERIHRETPGSIIAGQFENPANPAAHEKTTGPEIWADTEGRADIFVACVGTGGTITGTGKYLKAQNAAVKVIGVEPADSPLLTQGRAGAHGIQGIGANFIPKALDVSVLDEVLTAELAESYDYCREIVALEGLLLGISSGAAISAAVKVALRPENAGKTVVALAPDSGERYLSVPGFIG